jgi:hypothetical protein
MAAPKTVKTVALDGSNKDFEIPFEYLARKFVVLTLIGTDRKELVLNTDYRFTQRTIVTTTLSWGPAQGYTLLEIKRVTSATERLVDFSDGSILRASDLNTATVQALHIAEEGRDIATDTIGVNNDGNLDARGRRIVNLADAVDPGDAVTLYQNQQWAGSALNQANVATAQAGISTAQASLSTSRAAAALASQNAALASQNAAKTSETNSKASETNSKASETNSKASENLSKDWSNKAENSIVASGLYSSFHYSMKSSASATASALSASNALTEANRAKTEADKLGNANAFMGSIQSVDATGKLITWNTGWTLRANSMVVGDAAGITMTSSLLSRAGSMGVYSTSGNLGLAATTGSVDITANTGYVNAFTNALRVIAENSIIHFRSNAKMSALFSAPGNGALNMAVYSAAGDAPASFSFMSNGNAIVPGTVAAATLTASGTAAVTGAIYSRGRAVMIGATSAFVALTAAGSSPPGKCRMTHNLGVLPVGYQLEYRCVVAEYGYAVEDRLFAADTNYHSSATNARGGQLSPVSANVCDYYFGGTGVVILNKSTGVAVTMTPTSWQVRVTAYGLSDA